MNFWFVLHFINEQNKKSDLRLSVDSLKGAEQRQEWTQREQTLTKINLDSSSSAPEKGSSLLIQFFESALQLFSVATSKA